MLEPDRNLPNETLAHIFSHISQYNLTKVALVSHRFNAIAERVLYSSINIVQYVYGDKNAPKRVLGWCDAMKRNQLYDVPRKLSIQWEIHDTGIETSKTLRHSCSLTNDTIRRLTLLDTLEFVMGPSSYDMTPVMELVVCDLRLPNLQHCLLDGRDIWFSHSKQDAGLVCEFIASHSGLRYLAVLDISETAVEHVPDDAAPELSIFYGTPKAAGYILPGRPVHHLLLRGEGVRSENFLSRMALTSVPLRILDLSATLSPSIRDLLDIATHLPTIEILRVSLRQVNWDIPDQFLSFLALLNKPNWFDLSPTRKMNLERDEQRSCCYDWHRVCPSLRHIFFPFMGYYDVKPNMWEWCEYKKKWIRCEPPTRESAEGLYRYTERRLL